MNPLHRSYFRALMIIIAAVFALLCVIAARADSASVKLPKERSDQIKQLQDQQNELARQFQALELQKQLVKQRAAMELKMPVEQFDKMDLVLEGDAYVFKPKPAPTPTPKPGS
jgi:hypothetical protein